MSKTTGSPPKHSQMKHRKDSDDALLEKKRVERLLQTFCHWNNSLDGSTPSLERESSRRRLRAHLSTNNVAELQNLKAAAVFLKHQDIERMAHIRSIEQDNLPDYRLKTDELEWQDLPRTYQPRAMATLRGESLIIDWHRCINDSWRRAHAAILRRRTQYLTIILDKDLRPLNLAVLHCVGYLWRGSNLNDYAFQLPPGVEPGQSPVNLDHLLRYVKNLDDIPRLGERFELAKALVSTIFEIHNLGLLHGNLQPKNILFWRISKTTSKIAITKPHLIGFDISGPPLILTIPTHSTLSPW